MTGYDYAFSSHWSIEGDLVEVADILGDLPGFGRWWPSVYREIRIVERGDERQVGAVFDLFTAGWLPYMLHWRCHVLSSDYPNGFSLAATGDFEGRGTWKLWQAGSNVHVTHEWRLRMENPLLRYGLAALKPIVVASERWAMAMGERSLRLELARRHARTREECAMVPQPPGPPFVQPHRAGSRRPLVR